MSDRIQIKRGNRLEEVFLNTSEDCLIGEDPSDTVALPRGSCPGVTLRFWYDGNAWNVESTGDVRLNGRPVSDGPAVPWEPYVLSVRNHVSVQLLPESTVPPTVIPLDGRTELLIGRNSTCALQLKNGRVSGGHAKLYQEEGRWRICDINSTNGTFVNGKQVRDCLIGNGARIAIGPYDLTLENGRLSVSGGEPGSIRTSLKQAPASGPKTAGKAAKQSGGRDASPPPEPKPKKAAHGKQLPARKPYPDFSRSPRMLREKPSGAIEIEAAPALGSKPEINWLSVLLPVIGTLSVSLLMMMFTGGLGMMISVPMMLIGVLVTYLNYRKQSRTFDETESALRRKYQQYIQSCEKQLSEAAARQRDAVLDANPSPEECLAMARNVAPRLWERTPGDADFLSVRVGLGQEPLCVEVRTPKVGFVLQEDAFTYTPQKIAEQYERVDGVPVLCDLLRTPSLGIVGSRERTLRMACTLAVQIAAHHGYDDVRIAVIFPQSEQKQWEWMRWLPHTYDDGREHRYFASTRYEAGRLFAELEPVFQRRAGRTDGVWGKASHPVPHYVFFIADPSLLNGQPAADYLLRNAPSLGISCVLLGATLSDLPGGVMQILEAGASEGSLCHRDHPDEKRSFRPDALSADSCEAFARALAPVRLPVKGKASQLPDSVTLLEGYRVSRPDQIDIADLWNNSCSYKSMSVPIGVRAGGATYYFNIHEDYSGPHGLVAGTNGSGKSEMAQSWIASMALQFSPRDVNFVLVDFKGTSLLRPFLQLPHLAGSISNLDKDVRRCLLALDNEIERRQILVDRYEAHDILKYQKKRRSHPEMEEMPFLILIIDEFADFKAQYPDFTGALDHIFRGGRALGIYTVIMTQKPAGVVTEQMNANAKFRWCLKVVSESDSREMIGISDAAYLTAPGRSYVKTGAGVVDLVQPFYSGAPYYPDGDGRDASANVAQVLLSGERRKAPAPDSENTRKRAKGTQIEAVVGAIADYCRKNGIAPARQIWAPPLPERLDLTEVLPAGRMWETADDWTAQPKAPEAKLGLVDDPGHQSQYVLTHDFWNSGNLLVYGMSLSGKTTFLRTLAVGMCCIYDPSRVRFFLMEFGSFGLRGLESFPHVGGAAGDDEPGNLHKIADAFLEELARRKQMFRKLGVGSIANLEDAGGGTLPVWILLADNLNLANTSFPDLVEKLVKVTREGEAFGLYAAVTVTGSNGPGYQLAANFKSVLTLQLTDRMEYSPLVGRVTGEIPKPLIGRGLVRGPLEFQTAIAFAQLGDGKRVEALRNLAQQMDRAWTGERPGKIGAPPERVPYGSVPGGPLVLGLSCEDASPVRLPLDRTTGIVISAGQADAKSRLLTMLLRQVPAPEQAKIIVHSSSLTVPQAVCVSDAAALGAQLAGLVDELRTRQTARRGGSAEAFAPIVIVVDDIDECIRTADPVVVSQLEAFVRLGAGLNVTVIAADLAPAMEHCYFGRNILLETMHEGPILLTGGSAGDHGVVDTIALEKQYRGSFAENLLILAENGTFTGIRQMEPEA